MKILLLLSEAWNDNIHPNNNLTNWFEDISDVEIATVYANPSLPANKCCMRYFQLTEASMVKSILGNQRAGRSFEIVINDNNGSYEISEENKSIYKFFRVISNEFIRLIRDIIWKTGRINFYELENFIREFNPDIIFTQRMGSVKMCRIERIVKSISHAPMVAYTGDDEYTLKHYNLSPIFWIRRLWLRHELKKNIPMYEIFYSQSEEQMEEFRKKFNSNTKFLVKCGNFTESKVHSIVHTPIIITYAGKLYCNRWKTLRIIAQCISQLNSAYPIFQLNIYTHDKISRKQNRLLNDGYNSFIKGGVSSNELQRIYTESDILLHVESFDKKYSRSTKYSFSTKIIDCISSGCAVMAVGRYNQAGCSYLKSQNAAFVASSKEEIFNILSKIQLDNNLICQYARNAYNCGILNHQRHNIQRSLINDFAKLIKPKQSL